jgi:hypothetical protein
MRGTPSKAPATLLGVLACALAFVLTGCGGSDSAAPESASDPSVSDDTTGDATVEPSAPWTTDADGERTFTAQDYTYRLEALCFCPVTGPVEVQVEDGAVTSATLLRGGQKGEEAPDYLHLTIADLLERAADPSVASAEIDWPEESDWPTSVELDQIARAVDDEITYRVGQVSLEE